MGRRHGTQALSNGRDGMMCRVRAAEARAFARKGAASMVALVKRIAIGFTCLFDLGLGLNKPLAQQRDHIPEGRLRREPPCHLSLRHIQGRFRKHDAVAVHDGRDSIEVNPERLPNSHNRGVNFGIVIRVFGQLSSPFLRGGEGGDFLFSSGFSVYPFPFPLEEGGVGGRNQSRYLIASFRVHLTALMAEAFDMFFGRCYDVNVQSRALYQMPGRSSSPVARWGFRLSKGCG